MASIILSAAGTALGAATGIPHGAALGARFGQAIGRMVDTSLLTPSRTLRPLQGPRLADLGVQSSTYGKMIPILYGMVRIGGNIIWSRPIKETVTTSTSSAGGKGGGGKVKQSSTSYSYSITLAIGICEGALEDVLRIWSDAKQLDLSQYTVRIYKGDETQLPDSIIQSFEGADRTPAHRGLAYVVFEDFPLGDFGNRIPNFTFEVKKKALYPDYNEEILEDMISGMVMIPGAGEFVYDTQVEYKIPGIQAGPNWSQQGNQQCINMHNPSGQANALLSLDQLEQTCPNVEWVSVVVTWFGNNMDAGACVIKPGVEYQTGAITSPDTWQSGGFTRSSAHQITLIEGSPQYGGTPDDGSILRYLDELKSRGYNVLFYPLIFMDVEGKPWRGDLTGSTSDVADFFTKTNGYNAFITHYADLVKEKIDAFVIGSELKGLTKVADTPGDYPAVNELINLAADVKAIVGSEVKVSYAADWSEYHHTDEGWYNLDPLWASSDIDFIGIDAYFPLTDTPQNGYDVEAVRAGWTAGEGYDWYYSDPERTVQSPLSPAYAWKNIDWFWNNTHVNPDALETPWVPQSKKVWFTEYGFPSVDGATNQPNVFYDPNSSNSAFPHYSRGRVDFRAQRVGLVATQQEWKDSEIVERMFVWTWDARPFPYWPDLISVWTDGENWKTGHWVQGKLGISSLAAIVSDLCQRSGLNPDDINVSQITDQVEGYIISAQQSIRDAIETLQLAFFFDTVESDNVLKFVPRGGVTVQSITEDHLVASQDQSEQFSIVRAQEIELPRRVNVVYLNRLQNYQSSTQYSQREVTNSRETITLDLPLVFADQIAKNIADVSLFSRWLGRTSYQFDLPIRYAALEPADIIQVTISGTVHRMRIVSTQLQVPAIIRVNAVAEDISAYDFYSAPGNRSELLLENQNLPVTDFELLDIPAFPTDDTDRGVLRMAAGGLSAGWIGAGVYRSDDGGANYGRLSDIPSASVMGTSIDILSSGPTAVFDEVNTVSVMLIGSGELQSVTEIAALNGANAALLGNEIIQFKTATLVEPGKYILSGLLRGRLGTEWAVAGHAAGERFVLLDGRVERQPMANNMIGLARHYKAVTFGDSLSNTAVETFSYTGIALKPYSPVHVQGARDGSGNLTISWTRRARLGGNWQDGIDVPLNELSEAYEVEILDAGSVVRTLSGVSSPTIIYTAAHQVADFGAAQSSVTAQIYQLSGIIGRGYPAEAVI
jgi:hypothetical protein